MTDGYKKLHRSLQSIPEVADGLIQFELYDDDRGAELGSVWSHVERGKGHATRAMKALLELADEHGVDLYGEPYFLVYDTDAMEMEGTPDEDLDKFDALNDQRMDNLQLIDWYRRLGFEETDAMRGDHPEIVRRANSPIPRP